MSHKDSLVAVVGGKHTNKSLGLVGGMSMWGGGGGGGGYVDVVVVVKV